MIRLVQSSGMFSVVVVDLSGLRGRSTAILTNTTNDAEDPQQTVTESHCFMTN
jgi:hypothetical protein